MRPRSNPRWQTAPKLDTLKSQHRGLFDFTEIWYKFTMWQPTDYKRSRSRVKDQGHSLTQHISSRNVITQARIGWPTSNLVKILPVRSLTCHTRSRSLRQLDRKNMAHFLSVQISTMQVTPENTVWSLNLLSFTKSASNSDVRTFQNLRNSSFCTCAV